MEGDAAHLDEIRVVGRMLFRPHIAKHLVAARMPHRLGLAEFLVVLTLADGRMVMGDLLDFAAPDLIEPRIADMPHHRRAIIDQRQRQHARHPLPFGVGVRGCKDLVIRHRDGFADAVLGRPGLALQPGADPVHCDLGGLFPGGLPPNSIHYQEDTAFGVEMQRVFIVPAHLAGIARARASQLCFNHSK